MVGKLNANAKPDASILSDLPAGSVGLLAGADLKSQVQAALDLIRKRSQAAPGEDPVQTTLDEFEKSTGLNLETDILPWMGGDFVLSASIDDKAASPRPSAVFQLKLSAADRDKASAALDKLFKSASGDPQQK